MPKKGEVQVPVRNMRTGEIVGKEYPSKVVGAFMQNNDRSMLFWHRRYVRATIKDDDSEIQIFPGESF